MWFVEENFGDRYIYSFWKRIVRFASISIGERTWIEVKKVNEVDKMYEIFKKGLDPCGEASEIQFSFNCEE